MVKMQVISKNQNTNYLHMGDVISLWEVARNKIIGLSVLSIFYRQAKDKELKDLIKNGVDFSTTRHISKIQKILKDRGYNCPSEQNWERKFDEKTAFVIPDTMLDDEDIAMSMREIVRLVLTLEAESIRNATDENIIDLMSNILDDDNMGYNAILALQRKKNWQDFPPTLLPQ